MLRIPIEFQDSTKGDCEDIWVKMPIELAEELKLKEDEVIDMNEFIAKIHPIKKWEYHPHNIEAFILCLKWFYDIDNKILNKICSDEYINDTHDESSFIGLSSRDYLGVIEKSKSSNGRYTYHSQRLVEYLYRSGVKYHETGYEALHVITDEILQLVFHYVTMSCHMKSIKYLLKKVGDPTEEPVKETIFWIIDGYGMKGISEKRKLKAIRYLHEKRGYSLTCLVEDPYSQARSNTPKESAKEHKYKDILQYLKNADKPGLNTKKAKK